MTQMKFPTQKDWVSTVLEDIVELDISLELKEIEEMSKERFISIVQEKVKSKAFEYLISKKESRISVRAKGKALKYERLEMSEYLTPIEHDLSISEKKWILKCRLEDVDLGSKRKWNSDNSSCLNCPGENLDQRHILNCQFLLGKNKTI